MDIAIVQRVIDRLTDFRIYLPAYSELFAGRYFLHSDKAKVTSAFGSVCYYLHLDIWVAAPPDVSQRRTLLSRVNVDGEMGRKEDKRLWMSEQTPSIGGVSKVILLPANSAFHFANIRLRWNELIGLLDREVLPLRMETVCHYRRVLAHPFSNRRSKRVQVLYRMIDALEDLARLKAIRSLSECFAIITPCRNIVCDTNICIRVEIDRGRISVSIQLHELW
jgi:hypothetical protein